MRAAGYAALFDSFQVIKTPHWHRSQVADGGSRRTESAGSSVKDVYPSSYWPGDSPVEHLEFALKYDGTSLALLAILLPRIGGEKLAQYVASKPTGKYARRLWFLYEMLTGERLPIEDLKRSKATGTWKSTQAVS